MSAIVNQEMARELLREEVAASSSPGSTTASEWEAKTNSLWQLSRKSNKTFIAALGTALLAKATNPEVDARSLKVSSGLSGAYTARTLAKDVLAAEAPALRIDLGTSGREPLNNQPFFRESQIHRGMPVRANAKAALDHLVECVEAANDLDPNSARLALRGFLRARSIPPAKPEVGTNPAGPTSTSELLELLQAFVRDDSEGGKRAQAVAAGLLEGAYGTDSIVTDRVNDPDRHLPGDIGIREVVDDTWWSIVEVRDKEVTANDLYWVARKAAAGSVPRALVLAMANRSALTQAEVQAASESERCTLFVLTSWEEFLSLVAYERGFSPGFPGEVHRAVSERLQLLEASDAAIDSWRNWPTLLLASD